MNRNYTLEKLGFGFIVNHATGEIHRVKYANTGCSLRYASDNNIGYCTGLWALILIHLFNYNGCVHCFKKEDKG